jgi:hypothetical protein
MFRTVITIISTMLASAARSSSGRWMRERGKPKPPVHRLIVEAEGIEAVDDDECRSIGD